MYFLSSSFKGLRTCFQCDKTQAISFQIQNAVDIIGREQEDQLFALLENRDESIISDVYVSHDID